MDIENIIVNQDGEEMVVVEGKTYACKEELKKIGGVWFPDEKAWRVPKSQRLVAELLVNNSTSSDQDFGSQDADADFRKMYKGRRY